MPAHRSVPLDIRGARLQPCLAGLKAGATAVIRASLGCRGWPRVIVAGLAAVAATAVEAPGVDAQEIEIHGFVQANYSLRVADPAPGDPADDFLLGDHRVQLELGRSSNSGGVRFATKVDLIHDALAGEADLDLREAHVTFEGDRYDVTLGRQILTWGVGDLVFVNDLFTKDWTALIAGQPLQYLKVGSDAVNTNLYLGPVSIQVVAVPFFEPDVLPRGDRLVGYTLFPALPVTSRGKTSGSAFGRSSRV